MCTSSTGYEQGAALLLSKPHKIQLDLLMN